MTIIMQDKLSLFWRQDGTALSELTPFNWIMLVIFFLERRTIVEKVYFWSEKLSEKFSLLLVREVVRKVYILLEKI